MDRYEDESGAMMVFCCAVYCFLGQWQHDVDYLDRQAVAILENDNTITDCSGFFHWLFELAIKLRSFINHSIISIMMVADGSNDATFVMSYQGCQSQMSSIVTAIAFGE